MKQNNTVINHLVPTDFYLGRNYPNPFSEKTTIKFCIAYKTNVKLEVFNSEGKLVKVLVNEEKDAGSYKIEISAKDGENSSASQLCEGVYMYKLKAGNYLSEKKMIVSKKY
jgi:flagellar hook assembly protein FlgD